MTAASPAGRRAPRREGGFALVEALASLVVVGMISLMLVSGVTTGRRVWERLDGREASAEALDAAQDAVRDRLEQAYPQTLFRVSPLAIDFDGAPDRVTFLASPPAAWRPAPLRRYALWRDGAGAVRLTSTPDVGAGATVSEVLVPGALGLDIAYLGAGADGRAAWLARWRDREVLPDLVRVRVVFAAGDTRRWPDLLVRPRATIDTACQLNTVTHGCKGRT